MTTTWAQRRKDRIDDLAGGRSLTAEAFRRLRRDPIAITGAVIVGLLLMRPGELDTAVAERPRHHPAIPTEEFEKNELLRLEKETLGLFLSSHPLKEVRHALRAKVDCSVADLALKKDGEWVTVGGMIATPLARRGGATRRALSNVVVSSLFATSTSLASRFTAACRFWVA